MSQAIELGVNTFGDVTVDAQGQERSQAQVLRHVVEEARLADQVGLHFFGVGEHHRKDFAVSAPEVLLAGIAAVTSRIRLGSAVTVLSSDDPVRVFQRFSTLNAIIGGDPQRFVPYADLYRESLERFNKPLQPIGIHSPGHIAETDAQAKEEAWPHYAGLMNRIGAERGWQPIGRAHFEREAGPEGALFVGSPQTVATKIVRAARALGLSRFDLKYSNGTLPHHAMMKSIELYGTKVAPLVREALA